MVGIYHIKNVKNGMFYIGSSVNIKKRWYEHKRTLTHNSHKNIHLQRAWNKYGEENFEFLIIESLPKNTTGTEILSSEQNYLDEIVEWKTVYNINKIAGNVGSGEDHPNWDGGRFKDCPVCMNKKIHTRNKTCIECMIATDRLKGKNNPAFVDGMGGYKKCPICENKKIAKRATCCRKCQHNTGLTSGKNNPAYLGEWITPNKSYTSLQTAEKDLKTPRKTLRKWCKKDNSDKITFMRYKKSPFLQENYTNEECVGKTFSEIGFGFEPKQQI